MLLPRVLNYIYKIVYCQSNYKIFFSYFKSSTAEVMPIEKNCDCFALPSPNYKNFLTHFYFSVTNFFLPEK